MMKRLVLVLVIGLLIMGLAGCVQEVAVETTQPTVAQTAEETVTETTVIPTENTEPDSALLERYENGKVCVGIVPTQVGAWRYVEIPDQQAAVAAYEKAVGAVYSDEWWIKGDKTIGMMVVYAGEFWEFVESGELVCATGRIRAEDAAELRALCVNAAAAAGWKEAVQPKQLKDIVSAVLRQGDTEVSLTDPERLARLETMLYAEKITLGGTACPFTALLTMELESGENLTIALATDSCGVWMSEGSYYEFSNDSQPLYDLFGVKLEYGKLITE